MKRINIFYLILMASLIAMSICAFVYGQEETVLPEAKAGMTLWELVVAGGTMMIFIGLCSIAASALIIDNFITLRPTKIIPPDFIQMIKAYLSSGKNQDALNLSRSKEDFLYKVFAAGLDKSGQSLETIQGAMAEAGAKEANGLQQKNSYLSSIATISPMLGLLGTVLGMIQAFNVIAFQAGLGKPTLLAAGVSKALVTTAFGLIVGIPAMAFYFYFRNRAQAIIMDIETISAEFSKLIFESGTANLKKGTVESS